MINTIDGKYAENSFIFPKGASAIVGAKAQESLWTSPDYRDLYPYFASLESFFTEDSSSQPNRNFSFCQLFSSSLDLFLKLNNIYLKFLLKREKKIEVDSLIIGECYRDSEVEMMKKLVSSLARSGKKILYITTYGTTEWKIIEDLARNFSDPELIILMDPVKETAIFSINRFIFFKIIAFIDFHKILNNLSKEIFLSSDSTCALNRVARAKYQWSVMRERIEYKSLFVRNHFNPLSASAAVNSTDLNIPIITFQHGVISVPTSYVPIVAHKMICFGESSKLFLQFLDDKFFETTGRKKICSQFIEAGSIIDKISSISNNREKKTLLILDQFLEFSEKVYGTLHQSVFFGTIENILEKNSEIQKIIIRLHPSNKNPIPGFWVSLKEKYPDKIKFSNKDFLFNDLQESSLTLGLFSGALTISAACGLPTYFLWEEGWFYTADLSPFKRNHFITPEELLTKIKETLLSDDAYKRSSDESIKAASQYYYHGTECQFDVEFINSLFQQE